ncbi:MAG TPA: TIGR03118 family protein [Streptosporangiaceae bacterium]|nr:TIGR03118 family protein [Streptosporangiaceae bacterium]
MRQRKRTIGWAGAALLTASALAVAGVLVPLGAAAGTPRPPSGGTVVQTNLVSDLPGAAGVTDPNLVNPWGISESGGSPFWLSDNNSGLSTLYQVPGAGGTPVTVSPLVVNIPTPVGLTGGTPSGTVFNSGSAGGAFAITGPGKTGQNTTAPAAFLFASEDGTITGWNPGIDPSQKFAGPGGASAQAVTAVDNSGNNFTNPDPAKQTGAVYKGLAIATAATPIFSGDANSTAVLYAADFRTGTVEVYDARFARVTALPAGAFSDPRLPARYAPFNVQVLAGKVYVTYAEQDATRHDDVGGPGHGFVDVFNLDGTPGLAGGRARLISRGPLDSPWGLAIAPPNFAGLQAPGSDQVLLVGNFKSGFIDAFDAASGSPLGHLNDPDGEPIQIDRLWALQVGNGGAGGAADTVYFTAGIFDESHGLFGALSTAARGTQEGPAEAQWVQANLDIVQLDVQQLAKDSSSGAPPATIRQDIRTLHADTRQLERVEDAFGQDAISDTK